MSQGEADYVVDTIAGLRDMVKAQLTTIRDLREEVERLEQACEGHLQNAANIRHNLSVRVEELTEVRKGLLARCDQLADHRNQLQKRVKELEYIPDGQPRAPLVVNEPSEHEKQVRFLKGEKDA